MKKGLSVNEQLKIIHALMENMNPSERAKLSDKLLSYLLFDAKSFSKNENFSGSIKKEASGLSDQEKKLINDLAKRMENLRNLLGDNPDLFS